MRRVETRMFAKRWRRLRWLFVIVQTLWSCRFLSCSCSSKIWRNFFTTLRHMRTINEGGGSGPLSRKFSYYVNVNRILLVIIISINWFSSGWNKLPQQKSVRSASVKLLCNEKSKGKKMEINEPVRDVTCAYLVAVSQYSFTQSYTQKNSSVTIINTSIFDFNWLRVQNIFCKLRM